MVQDATAGHHSTVNEPLRAEEVLSEPQPCLSEIVQHPGESSTTFTTTDTMALRSALLLILLAGILLLASSSAQRSRGKWQKSVCE